MISFIILYSSLEACLITLVHGNDVASADPSTQMPLLRRSLRSNGTRKGDVIFLSSLRSSVDLTPSFNKAADDRLTKETVLEYTVVPRFL